ncbi:arylsulfatase [Wenyingzhuangia sp. 2_MG-2023]|uniref:arylsulfatase n=1 Tax=Wenyingzhuangia sp. 2_MG-2023 TaxID=3062639 RepID=UPI0026E2BCCA|nr:arylsulfatase [Wenyingzhuangia sp. 2_MG-2023]MDO6736281.1 arylsulfatase [Wenyingzhuangia sp. 2_MG-2023]
MKPLFFSILSFCLCSYAKVSPPLSNSQPNIIFVMTDDQGMGDFSCMGNQVVKTPNIDAFYKKSTRFTEYHVSPTCAPTRAALMSGGHEFRAGVTHTILERERMALDIFTMPQALKSVGYKTGIFGKWHLGDSDEYLPTHRGFDEVLIHGAGGIGQIGLGDFPPNKENIYFDNVLLHNNTIVKTKGFCTDVFFDAALAWTKQKIESKERYFTYISLNAPHAPLVAPEAYKKRFLDLGYDEGTAGRYGMIENIDDNFGRLIKKLQEWNALDNTLVIFTTDNGATHLGGTLNGKKVKHFNANLKGGKNSSYEGGNHVPFFWYWKNVLAEGRDINELTAHIDIYKTFVDLVGAKLPKKMQKLEGRSLLPLLENKSNLAWDDRMLFVHCGRWPSGKINEAKFDNFAVRTQQWRWVNTDQLYDVSIDPGEKNNVIAEHQDVVDQLKKPYDNWWSNSIPLMVNENRKKIKKQPLHTKYYEQLKAKGIPSWSPKPIK